MSETFPQMQPGALVETPNGHVRKVLRVDWRRNRSLLEGLGRDLWLSFWDLKPAKVS